MAKNQPATEVKASANATEQTTQAPPEPEVFDNTKITPKKVMNIEYVQDEGVQKELAEIVDALRPKTRVHVRVRESDKQHDLVVLQEGRMVLRVCPKRQGFSASLPGDKGKILGHTKATILKAIQKME